MRRREFVKLLGGAAVAWPLAARAQQPERVRRIGVLMNLAADDPESQRRVTAFVQGLQELGWTDGRNARIEFRWGASDADRYRKYAAELVGLAPDVILAHGSATVQALQQSTQTVPIVFVSVVDPVGIGIVANLARPGGNATGFALIEYGMSGKWLELLKEIARRTTRAAILRDPKNSSGIGQFGAIQSVAPALGVELMPIDVHVADEIERAVAVFGRAANGGLVVTVSAWASRYRQLIITLAAQHHLYAVYPFRYFVTDGGLLSYGPVQIDQYRRAAGYVDRILRGEKPADLPVQAPTRYELVINLKTAKALGLDVPPTLLARGGRGDRVRRRDFITLIGGTAAAWPLAARAQQPAMPVVGFLHSASPTPTFARFVAAFRDGLRENGYIESQNVVIEYQWAEGHYDRLPALANDLVKRKVAVILAAGGSDPAKAARAATPTIPIVFVSAADPIKSGLVVSLNRPGGNVTGVNLIGAALEAKRLGLLHELVPNTSAVGILINPNYTAAKSQSEEVQEAAAHLGVTPIMLTATTENDIDTAFASLVQQGVGALLIAQDPFFGSQSDQFVRLAAHYSVPTMYFERGFAVIGGLISYGTHFADGYRQGGIYAGRILRGEKPTDLPVVQSIKFELVINLKTAKALRVTISDNLLSLADEVIE